MKLSQYPRAIENARRYVKRYQKAARETIGAERSRYEQAARIENESVSMLHRQHAKDAMLAGKTFSEYVAGLPMKLRQAGQKGWLEMEEREKRIKGNPHNVFVHHQQKIARRSLAMPDAMLGVMGGPSKAEARDILSKPDEDDERPGIDDLIDEALENRDTLGSRTIAKILIDHAGLAVSGENRPDYADFIRHFKSLPPRLAASCQDHREPALSGFAAGVPLALRS